VSRTFGDIEGKLTELGGIPGVVIPTPEITAFPISKDLDYILLGCDGIFDVLTNEIVNDIIWETVDNSKSKKNEIKDPLGECLNDCVNNILKKSIIHQTEDNITVILVAFRDLLA